MNDVINTLTTIRTNNPNLENDKIDSAILLRALAYEGSDMLLYSLAKKQNIARNKGTNKIAWRRYKPLPVADNRGLITEGVNPKGMKVGSMSVTGSIAVYGAYIEVTRQTEAYNLDQLLVEYGPLITSHARETLELITRDAIEEDGGHYYVVDSGTASPDESKIKAANTLTLDVCRTVANTMKVARRKGYKSADRYTVVTSTEGMSDLLDDEKLLKMYMTPGSTNKPVTDNGLESIKIFNLEFYEYVYAVVVPAETDIDGDGVGTAKTAVDVHHTYVFGENAYTAMNLASAGIEMKRMGFEPKPGDNLGQLASLGWITMGFGAQVLDPVACTIISHAVKNPLSRPTDIYASQE